MLFALVVCAAASQAQLVVLAPTVEALAAELGVPVGVAGQARTVTAVAAVVVSVVLIGRRSAPPRLPVLGAGCGLLGAAAVALAGDLGAFLLAHVLVGIAVAALLSAAFAGVAARPQADRLRAAGWVAAGNAAAWIAVAPAVGALTQTTSWRVAEAVPAGAALAALAVAHRIPAASSVPRGAAGRLLAPGGPRRWLVGETVAYAAWTALLTFAGAYFVARFGVAEGVAGVVLAGGAAAYTVGAARVGRLGTRWSGRGLALAAAAAMAGLVPLLLAGPDSLPLAAALFALVGLAAGVRTPASAALGLAQLDGDGAVMMTARTAATQLGYLLGAAVGGPVLVALGYPALGLVLAAGLGLSILVLAGVPQRAVTRAAGPASG